MRNLKISASLAAAAFLVAGCAGSAVSELAASSQKLEQDISGRCLGWHARAEKAAHPDAETIALHDRLAKKAADLQAAAASQQLHGEALQTAAGKIAQAQIEADAVYDAQANLEVEADCWHELEMVKDTHKQMNQRLADSSNLVDTPASPAWTPTPVPQLPRPSVYVPPAGSGLADTYS